VGALLTPFVIKANYIPFARFAFSFTAFKPVVLAFTLAAYVRGKNDSNAVFHQLMISVPVLAFLMYFVKAIWSEAAMCSPFQFVWQ
jgi:hypothetical protein